MSQKVRILQIKLNVSCPLRSFFEFAINLNWQYWMTFCNTLYEFKFFSNIFLMIIWKNCWVCHDFHYSLKLRIKFLKIIKWMKIIPCRCLKIHTHKNHFQIKILQIIMQRQPSLTKKVAEIIMKVKSKPSIKRNLFLYPTHTLNIMS